MCHSQLSLLRFAKFTIQSEFVVDVDHDQKYIKTIDLHDGTSAAQFFVAPHRLSVSPRLTRSRSARVARQISALKEDGESLTLDQYRKQFAESKTKFDVHERYFQDMALVFRPTASRASSSPK